MKKSKAIDWSVLKGASILLGITLLLSGGMMAGTFYYKDQMRMVFEQDNRRFMSESRRYLDVDQEEQVIREFLPQFQELEHKGRIGDEHRLNWRETITSLSKEMRIGSLKYSIEPRAGYVPHYELSTGQYALHGSTMHLNMKLLHELDLLNFLEQLQEKSIGRFTVESCNLERRVNVIVRKPGAENIKVECEVSWLTLVKPEEEIY